MQRPLMRSLLGTRIAASPVFGSRSIKGSLLVSARCNSSSCRTALLDAGAASTLPARRWQQHRSTTSRATRWFYSTQSTAPPSRVWNFEEVKSQAEEPNKDIVLVDVRERSELEESGLIPHSVHMPTSTAAQTLAMDDADFEDALGYSRPGKDKTLVFYCKKGIRARAVAEMARQAGWASTGEYMGSWAEWEEMRGPVEAFRGKKR